MTLAMVIAVLLVLHAISWTPSNLLWPCHIASLAIAVGLVFDLPRLIAAGTLFLIGMGIPAYLFDLVANGDTTRTSLLLHTIPMGSGVWALWGRPLPSRILFQSWLFYPGTLLAAYLFADPALNVMLVYAPYGPTASLFPALWMSWAAFGVLSFAFLAVGSFALRLGWRRWG
jgi:hypothetical protein